MFQAGFWDGSYRRFLQLEHPLQLGAPLVIDCTFFMAAFSPSVTDSMLTTVAASTTTIEPYLHHQLRQPWVSTLMQLVFLRHTGSNYISQSR